MSDWILGYRGPNADPDEPRAIGRAAVERAIRDGHSKQGIQRAALDGRIGLGPEAKSYLAASNIEGNASIPFNPTGDGIADAANYGNDATRHFASRFVPALNDQAGLEAAEMGYAGAEHLERFQGQPTELASSDIKDLYKHYSKQIEGVA